MFPSRLILAKIYHKIEISALNTVRMSIECDVSCFIPFGFVLFNFNEFITDLNWWNVHNMRFYDAILRLLPVSLNWIPAICVIYVRDLIESIHIARNLFHILWQYGFFVVAISTFSWIKWTIGQPELLLSWLAVEYSIYSLDAQMQDWSIRFVRLPIGLEKCLVRMIAHRFWGKLYAK